MTEAFATAGIATAAGLLLLAVKRAAIGDRPFLRAVRCWLKDSHREQHLAQGGWRCSLCGAVGANLGVIAPMGTTYDRKSGTVTRSLRWPS